MKNRLSVGDYEIAYGSVRYETCFRARVSVRLRTPDEPERVAKYVYFTAHDSAKAALAEAWRQAEHVRARPALRL